MSLNFYNLEIQLAQKMRYAATDEDLLFYAKTLELIRNSSITVVGTFAALPTVSATISGELYFVQSDELLYIPIKSLGVWRTISNNETGVWTWGSNGYGRLGDNTVVDKSSPVSVVGGFTDWCQVSTGVRHTAAIGTSGSLWAWGFNGFGRLGDNTVVAKSSPVSVIGGFSDWRRVAAGGGHTAAIRNNGTIWTWGFNNLGTLGDNSIVAKSSPVSVVGGFTDWCQVSAGGAHTAAIRNGTIWTWGYNLFGQLGDNTIVNKSSPVSVVGGLNDWRRVSAGGYHTAGLRTNGTLWTWGGNNFGQLGDNTIVNKSSPVSVVGGFTDWCQVSAGQYHTAAVRTNGTIWTWGINSSGQLGDNTTISKSSPVSVVGGFTAWCQVSAGQCHTAAVRTNGTIWAWGFNCTGQLGDNTVVNKSSPVSVIFSGEVVWCQVSSGQCHTTAIRTKTF